MIQTIKSELDSTLILDVRSASSFRQSHLKHSVTFNLPTTLLKRPLYGADRIQASLATAEDRERFGRYQTALPGSGVPIDSNLRLRQIVVIDHDTRLITPSHPLSLVLNKFTIVGFGGRLVWLYAGFQGLLNWFNQHPTQSYDDLLQFDLQSSDRAQDHPSDLEPGRVNDLRMSLSIPPPPLTGSLPTPPVHPQPGLGPQACPGFQNPDSRPSDRSQRLSHHPKRAHMRLSMLGPFSPFAEQPPSLSKLSSPVSRASFANRSPHSAHSSISNFNSVPQSCTQPTFNRSPAPNPFFDNIRQLNERLSLAASLQNIAPIELPILSDPIRDLPRLPAFLRRLIQDLPESRAQRLAHEFHDLELAEQLRLQDVMRWESSRGALIIKSDLPATSLTPSSAPDIIPSKSIVRVDKSNHHDIQASRAPTTTHHPFSISAGVELGYKNRYKNIWPYEHTRIRLGEGPSRRSGTDYVNASMISFRSDGAPEGLESSKIGKRKYIATQGPLTSTFEDFWSVVGEEDVGLIVMITRRHEAGREKCADYVRNGQYDEIVISVDPPECGNDSTGPIESDGDEERSQSNGFFCFPFNANTDGNSITKKASAARPNTRGLLRKKMINLSRVTRPDLPARKIAHIQYRGWPDFDVPPAAEEVLKLIEECHGASDEIIRLNDEAIEEYSKSSSTLSLTGTESTTESLEDIRRIVGRGSGPVIVHCSAGVGRTGSFILLDVMIEVLKAKHRLNSRKKPTFDHHQGHHQPHQSDPRSQHDASSLSSHPSIVESQSPSKNRSQIASSNTKFDRMTTDDHQTEPPPNQSIPSKDGQSHQDSQHFRPDSLPKFLASQLCDCRAEIAPIWQEFPIMAVVNEMREQRMSMVANYRQYVFLHEVLLHFMIQELEIPTTKGGSSTTNQVNEATDATTTSLKASTCNQIIKNEAPKYHDLKKESIDGHQEIPETQTDGMCDSTSSKTDFPDLNVVDNHLRGVSLVMGPSNPLGRLEMSCATAMEDERNQVRTMNQTDRPQPDDGGRDHRATSRPNFDVADARAGFPRDIDTHLTPASSAITLDDPDWDRRSKKAGGEISHHNPSNPCPSRSPPSLLNRTDGGESLNRGHDQFNLLNLQP